MQHLSFFDSFHKFSEFPFFFFPPTMAQRGSSGKGLTKEEAKAAKENYFSESNQYFEREKISKTHLPKKTLLRNTFFVLEQLIWCCTKYDSELFFLKYQNLRYVLVFAANSPKILRKMVFLRKRQPPYPPLGDWAGFPLKSIFAFLLEILFLLFLGPCQCLSLLFFFVLL